MDITGRINRRCSDRNCKTYGVLGFFKDTVIRTRYSTIRPLKDIYANDPTGLRCKVCDTAVGLGQVRVFSLYSADEQLVKNYRTVFFYETFCRRKGAQNMSIDTPDTSALKQIEMEFDREAADNNADINLYPVSLRFRTGNSVVNNILFSFRTVICSDDSQKLKPSEGIMVLLDAKSTNIDRDAAIDSFLVDLRMINTRGRSWEQPLYIGLCVNGCEELEKRIVNSLLTPAESDELCRRYLIEQNNEEILTKLSDAAENVTFFVYRIGMKAAKTDETILNVREYGVKLMCTVCPEFGEVFTVR